MNDHRRPDDQDGDDQPTPRHPIFNQRAYQSALDQQIAAGQAKGMFDNLPGAGKPLATDEDVHVPEDLRVGFRMLRTAGFAPPWIEQRKEIADDQEKLNTWLQSANARWRHAAPTERDRLSGLYREKLTLLYRKIMNYNLSVPSTVGQMPGIRVEEEMKKLG